MGLTAKDFDNQFPNTWCPGCGNFPILASLKQALAELNLAPHQVALVSGIGQAGKLPHYLRCNFFNGLHGRALAVAQGIRFANSGLPVIAVGGDGDMYGEGGNHFLHALRRNVNLTMISHNNQVFGLTQGQASPTTEVGVVTKSHKHGVVMTPMNPLAVAILFSAPFVARGFSGNGPHLVKLIKEAVLTEGLALIDVLQPCVTYDKVHTFQWYSQRVYDLNATGHDEGSGDAALEKARQWGDRIPIGVFYRNPKRISYEMSVPVLRTGPLLGRDFDAAPLDRLLDSFL